ncbi:MAG: hypothetical protein MUO60_04600, partial [Clostridiaceae bacterium]|nr:hypothetical protein [Clostridiaceae bacterium]
MSMSNKGIKGDRMVRISLGVFTFIIIFLISLIIPKSARADNDGGYKNYFYVNVINNVLSVIQPSENAINMKTAALSFLGIDVLNPITIITKEVAYLDINKVSSKVNNESNESNEEENLITFILNPFKL